MRDPRAARLAHTRKAMRGKGLAALVVNHLADVRYLTGFTGSAGAVLVRARTALFFTDFRYKTQSSEQVYAAFKTEIASDLYRAVSAALPPGRVGFQRERLLWLAARSLRRRGSRLTPVSSDAVIGRARKQADEVERIERAQRVTDAVFEALPRLVKPGMTERGLALAMDDEMRRAGCVPAFPTIVAGDAHSALPHAEPRPVRLPTRGVLLVDFGAAHDGYASDMTRTVWLGRKPDAEFVSVYRVVHEAMRRAGAAAKPGMRCSALDAVAREHIVSSGYGDAFGHGLGHGVGLEVHEHPYVGPSSKGRLVGGETFTVEPGVYLEGRFGVRVENVVHLGARGARTLTGSPSELHLLRDGKLVPHEG